MPSVKNPNGPSKNRLAARASAAKKVRRKRSELARNKISKQDVARGARPGILPTSGPRAKVSAKKARKLEKKMGYALKRRMEAEGEKQMLGEPELATEFLFASWSRAALTSLVDAPDVDAEVEKQLNAENDMDIQ
ncbi:hypothetical protein X797_001198 [Metarhizium robertsii]|uniref:Ribosome biogenesis protein ALB1 n=2 Tax=Metarhizium robertsii TaxID=568076 RepID=E9EXH0_METRA|nr:uncharacterized protein MAA_04719 [Metarhizium robertsii ARSEF 23]EFY99790.1 hypothetical protein MAA_04719 [Metarhizium robertsii ARSEF 23]EXV06478.1 hypothetical protein X797_001198 [Metarhizium robertsii]